MSEQERANPAEFKDWNVAFLVKDYPPDLEVNGPEFFMVKLGEGFLGGFRECAKKTGKGERFVGSLPAERFMWFGVRVRCAEAVEAVVTARHRVEGFIDASVLTIDTSKVPEICDVVWLGVAGEPNMRVQDFHYDDWIHSIHGGDEGTAAWNARTSSLRERLVLFYELAADTHSKAQSKLGIQLRHSLRMFRYGIATRCFGVEFICKFCALEGLVCGNATAQKKKLLLDRLGILLRAEPDVRNGIGKLWKYRSEAVHTAQAFDSGSLDQGAVLGVHIDPLNRFFRAAVVFALDNLKDVRTVEELWAKAGGYTVPTYAVMQRPKGMEQFAMKNMLIPLSVVASDHGKGFDQILAKSQARYAERLAKHNAAP